MTATPDTAPLDAAPPSVAVVEPSDDLPHPRPADTATPDACVRALYAVISGPPEQPRDWRRFRALCRPDAVFLLASRTADGAPLTQAFDVARFVAEGTREFARRGLWERELAHRVERFGRVAHVFSSYASVLDHEDAPVVARGVNSVQLVEEPEGGWRIAHLAWDRETPTQPLPASLDASLDSSRDGSAVGTHARVGDATRAADA